MSRAHRTFRDERIFRATEQLVSQSRCWAPRVYDTQVNVFAVRTAPRCRRVTIIPHDFPMRSAPWQSRNAFDGVVLWCRVGDRGDTSRSRSYVPCAVV